MLVHTIHLDFGSCGSNGCNVRIFEPQTIDSLRQSTNFSKFTATWTFALDFVDLRIATGTVGSLNIRRYLSGYLRQRNI